MNFYNEIDPFAAAWLRELIKAGHIAPGVVDERSIEDIKPDELKQYTQCHFFAGIGVWSYALRCAGWPDDRPVWTGSCPCQPFSTAGKRTGTADERHLWPAWFHLIEARKPAVVFGEQVDAAIRQGWLDIVQADLEGIGYAFRPAGLPACGFGAPHIRQRIFFVADSANIRRDQRRDSASSEIQGDCTERERQHTESRCAGQLSRGLEGLRSSCGLADNGSERREWRPDSQESTFESQTERRESLPDVERNSNVSDVGNTEHAGLEGYNGNVYHGDKPGRLTADALRSVGQTSGVSGFWKDADWIYCRDEKYRAVESGSFPLAHGATARVGRLRGYGNAIVAPVAEAFIRAYLESLESEEVI